MNCADYFIIYRQALAIDPHNSNHWLYGTGATVSGGHDLLKWDGSTHNVSIKAMAAGLEETAILGLISPPAGDAHLLSVVGDIGGTLVSYSLPYALDFSLYPIPSPC